ncbi:hypothetical protein KIW84_073792 [Lathyrus oleraceus]|uniref:O-acyltransferase WSD1 C-terminal domain-containing protein n=1 Tax=Pisum sativum TaxID=3888 RepID=A0A9D4ZXT9_PEA|nr:hypothetical protein KIW84_073792 [Pisum sativum]
MIFYGLRLYMEEMNEKTKRANSTAVVMLNTRNIEGYQSLREMQKPEFKSLWGNKLSFLQIPIPKLNQSEISNPLEFVLKARELIKRKKSSFNVYLIGLLMDLEMKLRGSEAVSRVIYDTIGNTSVLISNLVGPVEKMALANHPVNGLYFTATGGPQGGNISDLESESESESEFLILGPGLPRTPISVPSLEPELSPSLSLSPSSTPESEPVSVPGPSRPSVLQESAPPAPTLVYQRRSKPDLLQKQIQSPEPEEMI